MYRTFNELLDRVTGFPIGSSLKSVQAMDAWSREQILRDQRVKFGHLSRVAGHSDFYREHAGKDLEAYPVLEKHMLKTGFDRMRTHIRKPYSIHVTSGSTGSPVRFIVSREMLLAKRVSHQKMLHWFGLRREDPEFKIGGIKADRRTMMYYRLRNKRYCHSLLVVPENSRTLIREFNRFRPGVLYGYPSAIDQLIDFARQEGVRLHDPSLIVTHGEMLYPETAGRIRDYFPSAPQVNQYWASEANMAVSCPMGRIHMDEDTVICEVINQDRTGTGDLLVTNLYSYDLPLIRYRIGDRVRFSDEPCPCGRKSRVIDYIEGRDVDIVERQDGKRIPATGTSFHRFGENIWTFQLIFHRKDQLIEFRYRPVDPSRPIDEKNLSRYIKEYFGLPSRITSSMEMEFTGGGKYRRLIIKD